MEVVAEQVTDDQLVVFHAMTLRASVAAEVLDSTGGALDLRDYVTTQRR